MALWTGVTLITYLNKQYDSFQLCIFQNFGYNFKASCQPKVLQINTNRTLYPGHFPFKKYSSLKFQKFYALNERVHSSITDPTKATTHLVVVLSCIVVTRIQKNRRGHNKFVKWKGTFQSDRLSTSQRGPP